MHGDQETRDSEAYTIDQTNGRKPGKKKRNGNLLIIAGRKESSAQRSRKKKLVSAVKKRSSKGSWSSCFWENQSALQSSEYGGVRMRKLIWQDQETAEHFRGSRNRRVNARVPWKLARRQKPAKHEGEWECPDMVPPNRDRLKAYFMNVRNSGN